VTRFAPPQTEILVVDDGSPRGIISQAAAEFPGVKTIRQQRSRGFCFAANLGIAHARGQVVELLNDDAEVTQGWAERALRWFADERVAAVAPLILQNDPIRLQRGHAPVIDSAGDEYDPGGYAVKRGHGVVIAESVPTNLTEPGCVWGASAAAAFYRREAVLRAGGFPERFGAYFEDVDLAFRLRGLDLEIMYEPGSVVWHRVSSSYGRKPGRRILEQQSCNEERVFWRNTKGRARVQWLPRHGAVLVAKGFKRFQEGALLPWLLGRVRAMLG
jgi:GT2 family glycosyltransferase